MKVVQLLVTRGPCCCQLCGDVDCFCCRVMALSESFSKPLERAITRPLWLVFLLAPPVQAFRGLSCLRSFSVAQGIRDIEGPPWAGSYSVDRCVRHLKGVDGVLLWSPERQVLDGPASLLFSC